MKRWWLLACLLVLLPVSVAAEGAVPIGELLKGAPAYDGLKVTIEGEALGDVMRRGDHGWINVGDGTGVIGVWAPTGVLDLIRSTGVHGRLGDRVRVSGTFHRAAPNLGGDTALITDHFEIVAPGRPEPRPLVLWQVLFALVAAALGAGLALTLWRRRTAQD